MTLSFYTNKQGNQWEKDKDDASDAENFSNLIILCLERYFYAG